MKSQNAPQPNGKLGKCRFPTLPLTLPGPWVPPHPCESVPGGFIQQEGETALQWEGKNKFGAITQRIIQHLSQPYTHTVT